MAVVLVAGAITGMTFGATLRLAMRVAAVMEGDRTVLTPATLGIIVAGSVPGIVVTLLISAAARYLPGLGRPFRVGSGLFTMMLPGVFFLWPAGELNAELQDIGNVWVNYLTFGTSLFLLGYFSARAASWADGKLPGAASLGGMLRRGAG